jgi:hypothetical protein
MTPNFSALITIQVNTHTRRWCFRKTVGKHNCLVKEAEYITTSKQTFAVSFIHLNSKHLEMPTKIPIHYGKKVKEKCNRNKD